MLWFINFLCVPLRPLYTCTCVYSIAEDCIFKIYDYNYYDCGYYQ